MTDGCMNGLVWFVSARKFCEFSILPISLHILHKSLFLESIFGKHNQYSRSKIIRRIINDEVV